MAKPIKLQLKDGALEMQVLEEKLSDEQLIAVGSLSSAISLKRIATTLEEILIAYQGAQRGR